MKKCILVLILALTCSCSMLNKKVGLSRHAQTDHLNLSGEMERRVILIKNDSNTIEAKIQIVPNGKFTYSLAKGFEGEATSLVLVHKTSSINKEKQAELVKVEQQMEIQSEKVALKTSKSVQRLTAPWVWIGLGLLVFLFVYYRWIR